MTAELVREQLDREMSAVLLQLRLCSTVPAQSYGSGGAGHPDSAPPPAGDWRATDRLVAMYWAAMSNWGRQKVIERATAQLESNRRRVAPLSPESISLEETIIDDGAGFSSEEVGQRYGLDAAHVRRIRQRSSRDPETGALVEDVDLGKDERRAEVARMKAKNMSTRQIAFALRCSQALVVKDLKALAA